jgi:hypothetical protein
MNRWSLRGAAALAVLSLAIAGCQNQGGSESVDSLPSIAASIGTESMGTESMGTDGSMDMSSPSEEASPSGS